jgi:hypothetical protein
MKLVYGMVAVVLMSVGASMVQAHSHGNNILFGIATGAAARATSYALKEQGNLDNTASMVGATFMAGVCVLAAQSNGGGLNGAFEQTAAALGTYVASMYVFRTVGAPAKA